MYRMTSREITILVSHFFSSSSSFLFVVVHPDVHRRRLHTHTTSIVAHIERRIHASCPNRLFCFREVHKMKLTTRCVQNIKNNEEIHRSDCLLVFVHFFSFLASFSIARFDDFNTSPLRFHFSNSIDRMIAFFSIHERRNVGRHPISYTK